MNSNTIKGDWKQMRGQVKEAFGKLTDDDLLQAEGNVDQLTGAIQKRYGYTREQASQEWSAFTERTANVAANTANAARGATANAADHVRDAAENTADAARGTTASVTDHVRDAASSTADALRGAAKHTVHAVRGAAATGAAVASDVAAKAARVIDPDNDKDARNERRDR